MSCRLLLKIWWTIYKCKGCKPAKNWNIWWFQRIDHFWDTSSETDSTFDEEEGKKRKWQKRKKGRIIAKEQRKSCQFYCGLRNILFLGSGEKIVPCQFHLLSQTFNVFCTIFSPLFIILLVWEKVQAQMQRFLNIDFTFLLAFDRMITTFFASVIVFALVWMLQKDCYNQAAYKILHVPYVLHYYTCWYNY